ncbi:hypothetical protein FKM82_026425 [Ascaphus truei]
MSQARHHRVTQVMGGWTSPRHAGHGRPEITVSRTSWEAGDHRVMGGRRSPCHASHGRPDITASRKSWEAGHHRVTQVMGGRTSHKSWEAGHHRVTQVMGGRTSPRHTSHGRPDITASSTSWEAGHQRSSSIPWSTMTSHRCHTVMGPDITASPSHGRPTSPVYQQVIHGRPDHHRVTKSISDAGHHRVKHIMGGADITGVTQFHREAGHLPAHTSPWEADNSPPPRHTSHGRPDHPAAVTQVIGGRTSPRHTSLGLHHASHNSWEAGHHRFKHVMGAGTSPLQALSHGEAGTSLRHTSPWGAGHHRVSTSWDGHHAASQVNWDAGHHQVHTLMAGRITASTSGGDITLTKSWEAGHHRVNNQSLEPDITASQVMEADSPASSTIGSRTSPPRHTSHWRPGHHRVDSTRHGRPDISPVKQVNGRPDITASHSWEAGHPPRPNTSHGSPDITASHSHGGRDITVSRAHTHGRPDITASRNSCEAGTSPPRHTRHGRPVKSHASGGGHHQASQNVHGRPDITASRKSWEAGHCSNTQNNMSFQTPRSSLTAGIYITKYFIY